MCKNGVSVRKINFAKINGTKQNPNGVLNGDLHFDYINIYTMFYAIKAVLSVLHAALNKSNKIKLIVQIVSFGA